MEEMPLIHKQYEQAIAPLVRRIDESQWEKTRATTIGGAGLSTALVLLITQIGIGGCAISTSFFCAVLAIPVWLALWQVGETYSFYGPASYGHFKRMQGSGVGVLLFLVGGLLLFISFTTLIWHFSIIAACIFLITSSCMVIFVYRHQTAVRAWAEANNSDGA